MKTETGLKTETRHHFFVQHSEYGRPVYRKRFFGPVPYPLFYFEIKEVAFTGQDNDDKAGHRYKPRPILMTDLQSYYDDQR